MFHQTNDVKQIFRVGLAHMLDVWD